MNRYVIIGSGVAGVTAAQTIRQQDSQGQIFMVSDDPHGYYSRPGMAYYLTGELSDEFLFPLSKEHFAQLGAVWLRERAVRIHPTVHRVEFRTGKSLLYDRLLIATGSTANRIKVPGSNLDGVVKLDNLQDARRIIGLARRGCKAVVVGGGITALELVEGLTARGARVHLFLNKDHFWSGVLEARESRIVEERLIKEGVKIHPRTELAEIIGRHGKVEAVLTRDGRRIKADLLAVAIGVQPCKGLAQASQLKVERGILVNRYMMTSQEDIFAAGDAAQVFDPASGNWIVESLWGTASVQGRHAGLNLTGQRSPYYRSTAVNVTRLAGITTTIIGAVGSRENDDLISISHGDSEAWRDSPEAIITRIDYDVNHLRIMIGEKTLTGALIMGDQSLTPILRDMITQKVDISRIRTGLLEEKAPVGDLIREFWTKMANEHSQQR